MAGSLTIRPITEADLPTLFVIYTDPPAARMAAFATDDPNDEAAFHARWRRILARPDVAASAVEIDGRLRATVSLWEEEGLLHLGYWVDREVWGQGVATNAVREVLDGARRPVRAHVAADNVASVRVLDKLGFVRVGQEESFAEARAEIIREFVYELR